MFENENLKIIKSRPSRNYGDQYFGKISIDFAMAQFN